MEIDYLFVLKGKINKILQQNKFFLAGAVPRSTWQKRPLSHLSFYTGFHKLVMI